MCVLSVFDLGLLFLDCRCFLLVGHLYFDFEYVVLLCRIFNFLWAKLFSFLAFGFTSRRNGLLCSKLWKHSSSEFILGWLKSLFSFFHMVTLVVQKPIVGASRHTQNIQISKVTGENEKCVFCFTEKTKQIFWPSQYFITFNSLIHLEFILSVKIRVGGNQF